MSACSMEKKAFVATIFCALVKLSISYTTRGINLWHPSLKTTTSLQCVGKILQPLPKSDDETFRQDGGKHVDTDFSWRTPRDSTIIPVNREKFTIRPELITFDAYNTLIEPSQTIGRWYREALNNACDMAIRLPRPILFTNAFNKVYAEMSISHPCFGSLETGENSMTSEQWWMHVVRDTYKQTELLDGCLDFKEIEKVLPIAFNVLYNNVFNTKEGWLIKEDAEYTLIKLREWRDQGSGPKIGVISNYDIRLNNILEGLGLSQHLDFILTSEECKVEKPNRAIFDMAMTKAGCLNPAAAFHIGTSIDSDIVGAASAGWTPMRFHEWFDNDFPDWNEIDAKEDAMPGAERRQKMMWWGRRDTSKVCILY